MSKSRTTDTWFTGRAVPVVHLNVRAGSSFAVPVCTVILCLALWTGLWCNKVDAVRLFASWLNLLFPKGFAWVTHKG